MTTKESEVRNETKEEIEIFMRGKFQGGEFIFDVSLTNGVRFTNQDYFENRQYFLKQSVDQLHYQSIQLVLTAYLKTPDWRRMFSIFTTLQN